MKPDNPTPLFGMLLLLLVLSGLDQTLLGTLLPTIAAALGDAGLAPWVFSSYLIAATVAVPVYGKLADRHGPRPMLLMAAVLFTVGSAACAAAPTMPWLIAARALQGLGGGGLMTLAVVATAWLYPPAERGRRMGMIGAAYSLPTLIGPLAGGAVASLLPWQAAFLVNLPCTALAAAVIRRSRFGRGATAPAAFDLAGAAWLTGALAALLWTTRHPIGSTEGTASAAVALGLLAGWFASSRRAPDPIVPIDLFRDRAFAAAAAVSALSGVVLFGTVVFSSLYFQNALQLDAVHAAWHMLPLMLGITVAAQLVGRALRDSRPPAMLTLAAGVLLTTGTASAAVLLRLAPAQAWGLGAALLPIGLGLGMCFPLTSLIAQRRAPATQLGAASALPTMSRSLGGALAVAVLGEWLRRRFGAAAPTTPGAATQAITAGTAGVFVWMTAAAAMVLPFALWLRSGLATVGSAGLAGVPGAGPHAERPGTA